MNRYKALSYFFKSLNFPGFYQLARPSFLQLGSCVNTVSIRLCSTIVPANSKENEISATNSENQDSVFDSDDQPEKLDRDSPIIKGFSFSMYADESPLIQRFIDLGVDLFKIQKRPSEAQYLVNLNIDKVNRYVLFLSENGIPADKIGNIITKNPLLFKEDLEDLQVRINYLKSKKFDTEMIKTILKRNPRFLSYSVKVIDKRLGFLQETFKLKGDEVRKMVTHAPGIVLVSKKTIYESIFALKEEMGLDDFSLKRVIMAEPSLLRKSPYDLVRTFEYLTKVMKVPLDLILKQSKILTFRMHLIQDRHQYLVSLGRAQYNNMLPGYISLCDLIDTDDDEFCEKVAKTSVDLYNEFLKTL